MMKFANLEAHGFITIEPHKIREIFIAPNEVKYNLNVFTCKNGSVM
ncbi:hypothetical protein CUJ84_pRLN3000205 (plasmid) [Rhizobium leguminosarum]|uniref:Uncharacterized protein n=1 Tax=Rhizobium leguminosarum TaxID=384 RepID=A0A2K9ZGH7_RHILE|nr:hypothetical protein CUJ84_pRLN3000205 [Rhizobium leguminosarum]